MTEYIKTKTCRCDAVCLAGHHLGKDADAYKVDHPQSKGKFGYICPDCLNHLHDLADCQAELVGNLSNDRIEYAVRFICSKAAVLEVLPILLYTDHGRIEQWFQTSDGFASPRYGDARFHKRLMKLASKLDKAAVIVTLSRGGEVLDQVEVEWSNRDERGRFCGKKRRAGDLLDRIDRAAEPHRFNPRNLNR